MTDLLLRTAVEPYEQLFRAFLDDRVSFEQFDERFREMFASDDVVVGSDHAMNRMLRFFAELDNTYEQPDRELQEVTPQELKRWVEDLLRDSGFREQAAPST